MATERKKFPKGGKMIFFFFFEEKKTKIRSNIEREIKSDKTAFNFRQYVVTCSVETVNKGRFGPMKF